MQTDDYFVVAVNVTRTISRDRLGKLRFRVVNATFTFFFKHFGELIPNLLRLFRRGGEERLITLVRGVVILDEITDVDFMLPGITLEASPTFVV